MSSNDHRSTVARVAGALMISSLLTLAACGGGSDDAGNSGDGGDDAGGAGETLTITSTDAFKFDPSDPSVPAGMIHLVHENDGATTHSLVIEGEDVRLVDDADDDIDLAAGEYVFYCDIPGHRSAGMEGVLTVTP